MGPMARTEPPSEVPSLSDWHTTKMCTNAFQQVSNHFRSSLFYANIPIIISHSGFLTLSESACGSRRDATLTALASLISESVLCRMKTGLPRHFMMTYVAYQYNSFSCPSHSEYIHTFLPKGIWFRSTSTFAIARTSADADMLTKKSSQSHQ